jgi:hypothetical protein
MKQKKPTKKKGARYGRKPIGGVTKLLGLLALLVLLGGSTLSTSYATDSATTPIAPDSLQCLTADEAAAFSQLLKNKDARIVRLEIDVWEARALAETDSLRAERYKTALLEPEPWYERILGNRTLWFVVGVYLGVKAAQ